MHYNTDRNMSVFFPTPCKSSIIFPLIKKPGLDPEILKIYRPVANLSFISKIIEKAIASQIHDHLINNDIVTTIGRGNGAMLVLLDLSAAFDTLFRRTLDEGTVPADRRQANVTPLYKKGNKSTPGNYRPVSLTSVVCKVLESIIKDAIMEHLEQHKLLEVSQHGFLPGRSCMTNLHI